MNIDIAQVDSGLSTLADLQANISNLNIAIISDSAPSRNGVGTYYVDLLEHLKSRVNTIEMFCPTIEDGKWKAGLALPLPGDRTQKLCMPNPLKMKRFLDRVKPHIIIIATPGVYGLVGAYWAGRLKIPAIAGFHTSFEQLTELYWKNSIAGKIVHAYFWVSNSYLFKRCQLVLANSEEMIEQAKSIKAPKTQLISTIISPIFINSPIQSYTGSLKKVLFAGRLAPEKNIDSIIDAARLLPDIEFTLAGDGPLREHVAQAETELKNLRCLGWLSRDSLREQIDLHDALILPSFFESFGTIALEAMARERLVIVSKGCGIAEWDEFSSGLYIMDGDAISETLNELQSQDAAQRIKKAKAAVQVTQSINETNLGDWCKVLVENSQR